MQSVIWMWPFPLVLLLKKPRGKVEIDHADEGRERIAVPIKCEADFPSAGGRLSAEQ